MIGLAGSARDQHSRTVSLSFGDKESQLARFVSAEGQAGEVIPLDPQLGPA
jgi:hypothetical protein